MASNKLMSDKTTTLLHASAIPVTPGATTVDASGIQLFEWSHALKSRNDCCGEVSEARYIWCGCFALAQIESRVGITSFGNSLAFSLPLMLAAMVIGFLTPWYIVLWSDTNPHKIAIWIIAELVALCALSFVWVRRTSKARTVVRERFQIPGTRGEDRSVAYWHSNRVIRQLVRHLDCESAGTFARVDTLPAYTQ